MADTLFFIKPQKPDFPHILAFLEPYEFSCVSLCSIVRKQNPDIIVILKNSQLCSKNDIWGVVSTGRVLFHCLPFAAACDFTDFKAKCSALLAQKEVKCIQGSAQATSVLSQLLQELGHQEIQQEDYTLLVLENEPSAPPEPLANDDEIRRCSSTDQDQEALFDLQKHYILSEVALKSQRLSDAECAIALRKLLKNQLVFALYSDGIPVAKANTNAIGMSWVQLGGVYTNPLFRRNHYSWHLLFALCKRIQKAGKKICLFVKKKNLPALSLYKKLGFCECSEFKIVYF